MAKFYRGPTGSIITPLTDKGISENAVEIIPGTVEAAREKHIPEFKVENGKVDVVVGSVLHPMIDVHYIEWIYLETNFGAQIAFLKPGDEPKASFLLKEGEEVKGVYAYCNLHGLWLAQ